MSQIQDLTHVGDQASDQLTHRYTDAMMNTFGTPQKVFVRGEGAYLWDADGTRYLDLLAGIAVNSLGHAHPYVLSAITSQLSTLGHVSNFFATPAQIALAERLDEIVSATWPTSTTSRVFFANSGTEANEAAFKITRMTGRTKIIAMEGSFHGRTMGALAVTHSAKYREPFAPLPGDVEFVPYGDADALTAAVDGRTAAVVLEPIQGENGVVVPPAGYLSAARQITQRHGALLWIDEVQTGIGRCGDWLASGAEVGADIVTFAKGLGAGFPIGACVATGATADLFTPGMHGSTFGGNPVAAIAGLAVLKVIERDGLLANVRDRGQQLVDEITALNHPLISGVRGEGLLRGIVLTEPIAPQVHAAAMGAGFVINAPRPDVIRIVPPLIITADQIAEFTHALPGLLATAQHQTTAKDNS
ncbi:acetylornithine transaminase [Granulicoccus phenolivorans]|uniref:acetylornithine transaminase n=1 Tax=Granulicoccus phenolivorans TaxID=266854 RepID=UPI00041C314F|nr:acetylornithine transaminase [Granulicoccus phenolivorans]